ncbi:bifunctional metallophosphatase/5'-nucleotidase [Alkalicoccus saliphilus]|uniref:Bifunctional metallophosphatase/5'-nucleotidase n=1 Tax=Alkalicoccus saliphilus TaxID=200989 RepID=A0A2T4U373_9BACI|nr:5'-nucleotidase C-terminal domain-containing protein [Alkalicoccus saliphilus]PTL37848.1 hypothetical protein C6Y45_14325 [Alkalicoccus saliphilus]
MRAGMIKSKSISAAVLAAVMFAGASTAAAAPGNSGNANGPKLDVEGFTDVDSSSFTIDFDRTYPQGLDVNRTLDVEVTTEDDVIEPEFTDYEVHKDDRSQVTVTHAEDDLDGLTGSITVNGESFDFDYSSEEEPFVLDIFHTNDIHGKIDPLGKISAFINEEAEQADNHLFLDAGDIFSGNAVVDLQDGEPMVDLLNEMNLDAMAIGNHEFDYGQEAFAAREEQAEFDWLSANTEVVDSSIPIAQPQPYEIYDIDGVEVGVFSLTQAPPSTRPSGIEGMEFHDYVETAEQYEYLEEETDILIALTHIGNSADQHLAENVDFFDVIIGGHSHTRLFEEQMVNGTPVVQAGSDSLFVGHFNLEFDGEEVSFNDYYLQETDELTEVNEDVQEMIDSYNEEAEEVLQEVIGETNTGLYRDARYERDTSLGNFWTDAMREQVGADIAITNNGGIRANIEPGEITAADIYTVEPFGNALTEINISGADMIDVIEMGLRDDGGVDLQVSGLEYVYYLNEEGELVDSDVTFDGEAIDEDETYHLVTNNFMAEGGSGYDFSAGEIIYEDAGQITNALFTYADELMDSEGAIDYEDGEGRITIEEAEE